MKKLILFSACVLIFGCIYLSYRPFSSHQMKGCLPPHSFYHLKLTQTDSRIPCLEAEIEGISFLAKLDLGHDAVISLPSYLLDQFNNKSEGGTTSFVSLEGKEYENASFIIPMLRMGKLTLVNLSAEESHPEFEKHISRGKKEFDPTTLKARIGWRAFEGTVLFIDLSRSLAICCDSIETLEENGYSLKHFASQSLSDKKFMSFQSIIEGKEVRTLIDTGCTLNLKDSGGTSSKELSCSLSLINPLNESPPLSINMGKYPLGLCSFHETPLPFEIEAILGVDFLETQLICIDFINNKLYLCPIDRSRL